MKKSVKYDLWIIVLFLFGGFITTTSLFMPPMGVIASSVVTVFGMILVLISVILAIQTHYTIEVHFGENKSFIWKPDKD